MISQASTKKIRTEKQLKHLDLSALNVMANFLSSM